MKRARKPPSPKTVLRKAKAAANRSKHTGRIMLAASIAGVRMPSVEFPFHPDRKWRFDFAWPEAKLAIEVNGGGSRGRHNTVMGATKDAEKLNAAQTLGWAVLQYTVVSVKDAEAIAADIQAAFRRGR